MGWAGMAAGVMPCNARRWKGAGAAPRHDPARERGREGRRYNHARCRVETLRGGRMHGQTVIPAPARGQSSGGLLPFGLRKGHRTPGHPCWGNPGTRILSRFSTARRGVEPQTLSHLYRSQMAGFEPATHRSKVDCSNQMSYICIGVKGQALSLRRGPGIRGWQRRPHRERDHLCPLGSDPSRSGGK